MHLFFLGANVTVSVWEEHRRVCQQKSTTIFVSTMSEVYFCASGLFGPGCSRVTSKNNDGSVPFNCLSKPCL